MYRQYRGTCLYCIALDRYRFAELHLDFNCVDRVRTTSSLVAAPCGVEWSIWRYILIMPSRREFEAFFDKTDTDGSGYLDQDELVQMMMQTGFTEHDAKDFMEICDSSGDGKVCKQEFLEAMDAVPSKNQAEASMRQVFRSFDKDGSGQIDKKEMAAVLKEMGTVLSKDDLNRLMEMVDLDGDGTVSYEEFVQVIKADQD